MAGCAQQKIKTNYIFAEEKVPSQMESLAKKSVNKRIVELPCLTMPGLYCICLTSAQIQRSPSVWTPSHLPAPCPHCSRVPGTLIFLPLHPGPISLLCFSPFIYPSSLLHTLREFHSPGFYNSIYQDDSQIYIFQPWLFSRLQWHNL